MRQYLLVFGLAALFAFSQGIPMPETDAEAHQEIEEAETLDQAAVLQQLIQAIQSGDTGALQELANEEQELYASMRNAVRETLVSFIEASKNGLQQLNTDNNIQNAQKQRVLKSVTNQLETIEHTAENLLDEWDTLQDDIAVQREEEQTQAVGSWIKWSTAVINHVSEETQGNQAAIAATEKVLENVLERYYGRLDACDNDIEDRIHFVGRQLQIGSVKYQNVLSELVQRVQNECLTSDDTSQGAESCRAEICDIQNNLQRAPLALQNIYHSLLQSSHDESCYTQVEKVFEREEHKIEKQIEKAVRKALAEGSGSGSTAEEEQDDEEEDEEEEQASSESEQGVIVQADDVAPIDKLARYFHVNIENLDNGKQYNYCRVA